MRILGLDLGASSIKAVEIDTSFGRYEIRDYHEHQLEPGQSPQEAARNLINALPEVPDKIAACLPTRYTTVRNLSLPTKDRKTVQSTVTFELEDELPFPLEDTAYDFQIFPADNLFQAHISATLSTHLETQLEEYKKNGIDPDLLTSEAWAFRSLCSRIAPKLGDENTFMVAHIGQNRTLFYGQHAGVPMFCQEINWGGAQFTDALAKRFQLPYPEAEKVKLDNGFILPQNHEDSITKEQQDFSQCLKEVWDEFVIELRQSILTLRTLSKSKVNCVYLSGGTSLLPGFKSCIEEELSIQAKPLQAFTLASPSAVTYSEHSDAVFSLALGIALSLVQDKNKPIQFRKGRFVKEGSQSGINLQKFQIPLFAYGGTVAALLVLFSIQSSILDQKILDADALLEKNVKTLFGSLPKAQIKQHLSDPKKLQNSLRNDIDFQRDLALLSKPNPHSPLRVLKELSSRISKDISVDMTQFNAGASQSDTPFKLDLPQEVAFTLLAQNAETLDRVQDALLKGFGGVQKGKTEESPLLVTDGKGWKVTFTGKPKEEIYGK